jgi:hypothetical protein
VAEFHQNGVIVIRALVADDIVKKLHGTARDVTRTALRSTPPPPSLPPRMLQLGNPYLVMEGWQQLGYLERIVAVGKQLMGVDIEFSYDQLFCKPAGTAGALLWHQVGRPPPRLHRWMGRGFTFC